ncbi:hypothetical protein [Mongoliibacter ruber]|uniref:Uncharacterized protein n=1 Tax=Mongoliibacter ruber TaxID=1750599 RepID=A0A2T0WV53_9BACT|nr:hypothetical protein [Mongoliibacter ruber]PRY90568.1 hypothetical protein CLW00_101231 [Mongoliibacter ruber]
MKNLFYILLMSLFIFAATSCKDILTTATDWYQAPYQDKVIEIKDPDLLIRAAMKMPELEYIELEHVKGIVFKPVMDFTFGSGDTTLEPSKDPETKRIKIPISSIKIYDMPKR